MILDGHNSHVTPDFLAHAYLNNILILRLPPHTSHLLQPLDVGLFGPLKTHASAAMEPLIQAGVPRIRKEEWLSAYLKGREKAFRSSNIFGGWRGAGLNPWHPAKILEKLPSRKPCQLPSAPSTVPIVSDLFDASLITSSPPDVTILQSTNKALNDMMDTNATLHTPQRGYIKRLTKTAERLRAQNSILAQQNKELQEIVKGRRQHRKGRQVDLEGHILLTTKELTNKVIAVANQAKEEKKEKRRRKPKPTIVTSVNGFKAEADGCNMPPMKKRWILSAVVV